MNLMFALKGIAVLFIFTVLCRFVLAIPLSFITTEMQTLAHDQGTLIESQVGPVLAMIGNVFTIVACIFGIGIVAIIGAIAYNGGGGELETRNYRY